MAIWSPLHPRPWSTWPAGAGPPPDAWAAQPAGQWLLIVELVSGPHQPTAPQLQQAARSRGLRLAWVFHDAIPLRLAQLYGARAASAAAHHRAYMAGLALADVVLANSHTSAAQLRAFLNEQGLPSGHVQALPLAAEYVGVPRCEQPKPGIGNKLLAVGSLEPRKNHGALLKAVAWLAAQGRFDAQLVLVGWPNDPRVVALVQRALALGLPLRWEAEADDARLPLASPAWRHLAAGLSQWLLEPELRARLQQQLVQRPLRSWVGYAQELLAQLG